MNREYHIWHSPSLNRNMELLVFGHGGSRVLVFPTSMGRYYEWEDRGMMDALGEHIERGWIQVFCLTHDPLFSRASIRWVVADRGYTSHAFREHIWNLGARPAIPDLPGLKVVMMSGFADMPEGAASAVPRSSSTRSGL